MAMTTLIVYASIALGVSFLCSILEAVVLSIPHTYIAVLEKDGDKNGAVWANLKEDDAVKPLTAILTLNTIAHTMGAAGVGSEVQSIWGEGALTIASIILTIAVLFLSEIIPKTLGTAYWKQLAPITGKLLGVIVRVLAVLIVPIQILKTILPKGDHTLVTRDDVAALADLGGEEGIIEEDEEKVIQNLLKLRDIKVVDIMTPRVVMTSFQSRSTVKEVLDEHKIIRVSRIPVYDDTIDDSSGIAIRSEILMSASRDEWDKPMSDFKKPVISLKTSANVDEALEMFLEKRQQFALVRDEFGGTAGIVTMEDVLETLLGEEIVDELDVVDDMRELAREKADYSEQE
ncbi:CNNM domain-containing protein [Euryarchaeota archaeon]|nr:CNNM domain-containing protein [Euryarchaeota archaeon]MDA9166446.1 CNNM domain-containing protein [Candidatus Poseidoniaceae archaeon]MDA8700957.1 CNNM domain-containing protein [Euryarchaeota archaeon]MDA8843749.1 CNNM domain-containing protein [Euryarchaeota archaeon]MDB2570532.1 CNNM domain-containing protein [Euryarchaeota archaeon]